jgi:hypothetical protein
MESAQMIEAYLPIFYAIYGLFLILIIASQWVIFTKAGQPGWASLVPIYNIIVLFDIIKKPSWWFLMFFIPIVNIIFMIKMIHALSVAFGKGAGFTAGLIFFGIIFYPILAFGSAKYVLNDGEVDTSGFGTAEADVNMEQA